MHIKKTRSNMHSWIYDDGEYVRHVRLKEQAERKLRRARTPLEAMYYLRQMLRIEERARRLCQWNCV